MLDEENLRRLAEMGIDVYLPRAAAPRAAAMVSPATGADGEVTHAIAAPLPARPEDTAAQAQPEVVLLADATSAGARALVLNIVRALAFAQIACVHGETSDEAELAGARALVMFGDQQVRAAGALVPAQRQREIGWVVGAELSALAADGSAKRALWSELKRMSRELATRSAAARR